MSSLSRGEKLRFDDVQDLMIGKEMHRKMKDMSMDAALVMKNREKGRGSSGGSQGRESSDVFVVAGRDKRRGIVWI